MMRALPGMMLALTIAIVGLANPAKAATFHSDAYVWDPWDLSAFQLNDVVTYGSYHQYTISGATANQSYNLSYERTLVRGIVLIDSAAGNSLVQCDGNGDWSSGVLGLWGFDQPPLGWHTVTAYTEFHDAANTASGGNGNHSINFGVY